MYCNIFCDIWHVRRLRMIVLFYLIVVWANMMPIFMQSPCDSQLLRINLLSLICHILLNFFLQRNEFLTRSLWQTLISQIAGFEQNKVENAETIQKSMHQLFDFIAVIIHTTISHILKFRFTGLYSKTRIIYWYDNEE